MNQYGPSVGYTPLKTTDDGYIKLGNENFNDFFEFSHFSFDVVSIEEIIAEA